MAAPHRTAFPSGNKTIAPLASSAPTVSVNAATSPSTPAASKPIADRPAYNGGTAGSGVVTTTPATGTTETYYEGGEGCDIFGIGGDDDDDPGSGANSVIVNNPPPKGDDDDDSTKKGDDDDDNKKGDDDDDNKSEGSSSSSSSGGSSDSTEHTLDVKFQGTHAQNVGRPIVSGHHGHSPVSRIALAGVLIILPLRRRNRTAIR